MQAAELFEQHVPAEQVAKRLRAARSTYTWQRTWRQLGRDSLVPPQQIGVPAGRGLAAAVAGRPRRGPGRAQLGRRPAQGPAADHRADRPAPGEPQADTPDKPAPVAPESAGNASGSSEAPSYPVRPLSARRMAGCNHGGAIVAWQQRGHFLIQCLRFAPVRDTSYCLSVIPRAGAISVQPKNVTCHKSSSMHSECLSGPLAPCVQDVAEA
jgi:hypothetical protein